MILLDKRGWTGTERICLGCASRVLIETDDLWLSPDDKSFWAVCCFCKTTIIVPTDQIPENVQRKTEMCCRNCKKS